MGRPSAQAARLGAGLRWGAPEALDEIVAAAEAERGNLVRTAARLGLPHRTVARWVATYPALERALAHVRARAAKSA